MLSASLTPIETWLVDDNEQFCFILCESFKDHSIVRCTKTFKNGNDLIAALSSEIEFPQVVLLDINMPGISGLETLAEVKILSPDIRVLMLTVNVQDHSIQRSIELGASGYLLKSSSIEEIARAIQAVAEGGMPVDPFVVRKVFSLFARDTQALSKYELTERDKTILRLIAEGITTPVIAERLCLSQNTIQTHIRKIFQKLDVHTRHELVGKALREKLI